MRESERQNERQRERQNERQNERQRDRAKAEGDREMKTIYQIQSLSEKTEV